ncbi:Pet127-domain-containing protein [Metschnikowia bicuspidata var. bicuspidata NRRL YB-4993]|uniref:Pet127-domain-containing protein n=1 Tax=Metschnikowia bicuspidata var. bicuspidata NRRL YB-4993 TaxID=869754 RepID=A0A1A0H7H8_9ASCO|nr:Pet127-domain-containing protein [Metschnikowia bicuspidata var. bicuspidata NRRL YB-4993]OBA19981.1 Pet127-domain-containing protein [Metschnikowia bicuspidata var. bicuspidata NRRL YB-4993]
MHGPAQSPNTKKQKNHKPEEEPNSDTKSPLPSQYITQLKGSVRPNQEELKQIHKPRGESIPKLAHKLDRVLFSPGVHFLQDPRTRVYNFNPYLKQIVSHEDFDFEKVQKFVSASKDATLLREAKAQNKKFYSSTSSMTLTLHQFYLFLNNYTPSEDSKYRFDFPNFSRTARDLPLAVIVEPKGVNEANGETIYSVTSDKSTDVEILLSAMGHCLEALLTTEEEEFKELLIKRDGDEKDEKKTAENVYNYLGYGDFLMRSQLDCYDSRLPGNGTFDLKTRAAASVRYDKASEAADSSYQIWKLKGNVESFQREFEDLIRTGGLLKYGFQARIGQMDGIFVAYHNINSFFGFQYLPLSEIDKVFYSNTRFDEKIETHGAANDIEQDGNMASLFAEAQFKASIRIWQDVMKTVERDFKGTEYEGSAFRLVTNRVSRRENPAPQKESFLSVFAVPISRAEADELQLVSAKYQTSFRENISDAERLENLEKIQSELNKFNEQLVEKKQLFSYAVRSSFYVNGTRRPDTDNHHYPNSYKDDIEWRYAIQRIYKNPGESNEKVKIKESSSLLVEHYLKATQLCTNMLTKAYKELPTRKKPSLTDVLRKYSEVGKIRLEKWNELENPPRIY